MADWICATCAVEYGDTPAPPERCAICEDERQYVPLTGQRWTTVDELRDSGHRLTVAECEPNLFGIRTEPGVGIGQQAMLVQTEAGNLLWDPPGFIDDATVRRVRELGGARYIMASHPHMYGVQSAWSSALEDAPVLVAERDREWLQRVPNEVEYLPGDRELLPGLSVHVVGGHFPGSAVACWRDGAAGNGVLLTGDTVFPNPSGRSVAFLRSYPNRFPLSAAVTLRVADALTALRFDRVYGNFGNTIAEDAPAVIRGSAERHAAWARGDFDHLT